MINWKDVNQCLFDTFYVDSVFFLFNHHFLLTMRHIYFSFYLNIEGKYRFNFLYFTFARKHARIHVRTHFPPPSFSIFSTYLFPHSSYCGRYTYILLPFNFLLFNIFFHLSSFTITIFSFFLLSSHIFTLTPSSSTRNSCAVSFILYFFFREIINMIRCKYISRYEKII